MASITNVPPVKFLSPVYANDDDGIDDDLYVMRLGILGVHDSRNCEVCEWLGFGEAA